MAAAPAVAAVDPEVFRCHVRRIGLLDSTRVLDDDQAMRASITAQFARMSPRQLGPTRDEMVALVRSGPG
jgi:hypothetical protein